MGSGFHQGELSCHWKRRCGETRIRSPTFRNCLHEHDSVCPQDGKPSLSHKLLTEWGKTAGFEQKRWHTFIRKGSDSKGFTRAPCGEGFESGRQLGIGVSSMSHLGNEIYRNDDKFGSYLSRIERGESPVRQSFSLKLHDRKTLLVARTLGDGGVIDRREYATAVGCEVDDDFAVTLDRLRKAALIDDDGQRITLSDDGRLVYDLVTMAFYPEHARNWLGGRQPGAA